MFKAAPINIFALMLKKLTMCNVKVAVYGDKSSKLLSHNSAFIFITAVSVELKLSILANKLLIVTN